MHDNNKNRKRAIQKNKVYMVKYGMKDVNNRAYVIIIQKRTIRDYMEILELIDYRVSGAAARTLMVRKRERNKHIGK